FAGLRQGNLRIEKVGHFLAVDVRENVRTFDSGSVGGGPRPDFFDIGVVGVGIVDFHSIQQAKFVLPLVGRTVLHVPLGFGGESDRDGPVALAAIATAVEKAADATEGRSDDHAGG